MRPVNLIPPEDRRGDRAPLRAGALSYGVLGALAVALIAVTALVMIGNDVTEKENQLAVLETTEQTLAAEAQALAPYAEFASVQQAREQTVTSLAESRFDWERILRELAIVNPEDVFMLEVSGTGGGELTGAEARNLATAGTPALTVLGCSIGQDAVARFVAALEDIDGVTRVGLSESVLEEEEDSDCSKRGLPYAFQATAAFDSVTASAPPTDPAAPPETNSVQEQTAEAQKAAEIVPKVGQ